MIKGRFIRLTPGIGNSVINWLVKQVKTLEIPLGQKNRTAMCSSNTQAREH